MVPRRLASRFYPGLVPPPLPARRVTRRGLLGIGAGLGLAAVSGCAGGIGDAGSDDGGFDPPFTRERATCVPRDTLDDHRSLADAALVYEPTGRTSTFWFDAGFHTQLAAWARSFGEIGGQPAVRWFTYGSWTNGGSQCDSWHNSGRAFDLARVRLADDMEVSCRYDQWSSAPAAELRRSRQAYWSLAAGLHEQFSYVLTYLYDASHANHIHVDNSRSGAGRSQLSTRSRVQVQAVQAICTYLWDEPVELTGRWDTATRDASRRVLDRVGTGGTVDDGTEQWHAFLQASAALDRD